VSLTISETESNDDRRRQLVQDLVDELTTWRPREMLTSFRRLHKGAISLVHLNVLTHLDAEGPQSMGRLADALDVSIASLTGIVSRMEARGLVERVHDEHDRRVVNVCLTDAGASILVGMDDHRRVALTRLAAELTEAQLLGLLDGHRALKAARLTVFREPSGLVSVRRTDDDPPVQEDSASR
jgi:DNA-binding MarR family transcriptional regulator